MFEHHFLRFVLGDTSCHSSSFSPSVKDAGIYTDLGMSPSPSPMCVWGGGLHALARVRTTTEPLMERKQLVSAIAYGYSPTLYMMLKNIFRFLNFR